MRKCKIDSIIDEINKLNNKQYPDIGHLRYANIAGDGRNYRSVFVISNINGGVTAVHNANSSHGTIRKLKAVRDSIRNKEPKA